MIVVMLNDRQVGIERDHLECNTQPNGRATAGLTVAKSSWFAFAIAWSVPLAGFDTSSRSIHTGTAPASSAQWVTGRKSTCSTVHVGEAQAAGSKVTSCSAMCPQRPSIAATERPQKSGARAPGAESLEVLTTQALQQLRSAEADYWPCPNLLSATPGAPLLADVARGGDFDFSWKLPTTAATRTPRSGIGAQWISRL